MVSNYLKEYKRRSSLLITYIGIMAVGVLRLALRSFTLGLKLCSADKKNIFFPKATRETYCICSHIPTATKSDSKVQIASGTDAHILRHTAVLRALHTRGTHSMCQSVGCSKFPAVCVKDRDLASKGSSSCTVQLILELQENFASLPTFHLH